MSAPISMLPVGAWACLSAVRVQGADVSRQAWLQARRSGVGGSELAALMGQARYGGSAYQVWLDKTGRSREAVPTEAMHWGLRLEAAVADAFAEQHGVQIRRAGLMRCRTHPRMLASVDRLTSDGGGCEVKCVNQWAAKQLAGGAIPPHWYWQLVHYLAVTGRTHWWLAVLLGGQHLEVRRIDRGDVAAEIARAQATVSSFWAEHVDPDTPPADGAPWLPAELQAGVGVEAVIADSVLADVARWRDLKKVGEDSTAELDAIKARLALELGTGEYLSVQGTPLVRWRQVAGRRSFDRVGFRREHPDLDRQYTTTGQPSRYLTLTTEGETR